MYPRLVCSFGDNDKDTDEEINRWNRVCRTDWVNMKERLPNHIYINNAIYFILSILYYILYNLKNAIRCICKT